MLAVVLFHGDLGFRGGYLGVDVFFVISGFLITSILREGCPDFWMRRVRRLFPALFVMLAVTLAAGRQLMTPPDYAELAQSVLAQCFLGANVFFWSLTGYWDGPAQLKPLLHTWSLAVEEQFYLLYPFVFRRAAWIALGSFALFVCLPNFYLLPQRAWELALGGVVAFRGRTVPVWASWFALMVLGAVLVEGGPVLVPVLCTAALLTRPAAVLSVRPLVFLGLISYSWYLWHWPVLVFARYAGYPLPAALALGLVLGVASWWFVERATRHRKLPAWLFLLAWAALVGAASVPPAPTPSARFFVSAREPDWNATTPAGKWLPLGVGRPSFLLWGDSHGLCVRTTVDAAARSAGRGGWAALSDGTPPVLGYTSSFPGAQPASYNEAVLELVRRERLQDVILVARWDVHAKAPGFGEGFRRTVRELTKAGAQVWVLRQVPEQEQHVYRALHRAERMGLDPASIGLSREAYAAQGAAMARLLGDVRVLDPTPYFFPGPRCQVVRDSVALYCDADHLTENGAGLLRPLFDEVIGP